MMKRVARNWLCNLLPSPVGGRGGQAGPQPRLPGEGGAGCATEPALPDDAAPSTLTFSRQREREQNCSSGKLCIVIGAALALAACGGPDDVATPEAAAPAAAAAPIETAAYEPKPAADTAEGTFARQCAYCHAPGIEHPGTMQLGATRGEDFAVLAEREDLTADYVKYIVRNGLNGMPPFTPTTLSDAELDMLAAYLAKR